MRNLLHKLLGRQPAPQPTDEDADLEQFFTDAEQALKIFEQLVSVARMPKRILVIHGVGGVGKSTVLKMYRLSCRRKGIPVALVGGEEVNSSVDILADWANDLSGDKVALPTFQATLTHYRAIQAKVEAEAKKSSQAMVQVAEKMGKAAVRTAVQMAASTIPVVGPLVGAVGGAGAEAFVDWLRSFLAKPDLELYLDPTKRLTDDVLSDLTHTAACQRLVLMADTFEQMTTLSDWLRDLAWRLPENVLLVIAGRVVPEWDRAWPGWMGRADIIELKEMNPDDLRMLVRRYYAHIRGGEPDPQQVEAIVQFARGLPMVATTVVRLWVKYNMEDFQAVKPQVVADLVDRLLEGVPLEMRPALEVAAVLRYFNADTLWVLLEGGDADTLYAELRRWPFIRSRREGLAVHDTVREMMNEALRIRTPGRFRALHERAAGYYEAQLEKATGDERERYALERLYHRIRVNEETGIRLFQETAEELVRYRLVNQLRVLLNDVNTYPLERENSRLWREYYNARLAHWEERRVDAERAYQVVGEDERAEPKLRAYALCDWGTLLRGRRIGQPDVLERSISCFELSLAMGILDYKLASNLLELGFVYRDKGDWKKALAYLNQALNFYLEHNARYDLACTYLRLKMFYAYRGDWQQMFSMQEQALKIVHELGDPPFLQIESGLGVTWIWVGRYAEVEGSIRKNSQLAKEIGVPFGWGLRDLALALGFSSKFDEATSLFSKALERDRRFLDYTPREEAVTLGFYGILLVRHGELDKAIKVLSQSSDIKQRIRDTSFLLETLNWLGIANEISANWASAENFYKQNLFEYRWTGRLYFECGALTGLVRVKHAQGDYASIPPLLAEAEQLAQQYEYNDHLASLRLYQGHIAWEGYIPEWGSDFDDALRYYQRVLIYALRYNRSLLDEVLSGRPQGTPMRPIIPHCLERGEEGRRMLLALRDWWKVGVNDIGTPRPDAISPIPEGISLLEAERIARQREPGNGSPQRTVVEQIEATLRG
jgi:tetratricopeptide (TPR) repeat protein